VLDPSNWKIAFIVDANNRVWMTTDAGATAAGWKDLTGNLADPNLRSLAFIPNESDPNNYALMAGGQGGVYRMLGSAPGVWGVLGSGLPNAPVFALTYSGPRNKDTLVVGTLGRGAWTLSPAAGNPALFSALPAVSAIGPQYVNVGTAPAPIAFGVNSSVVPDADLVVTATSSNPDLIPNASLRVGGNGPDRTLAFTPTPNATGSATITVTVSDGTSSSFRTIPVTVASLGNALALFPISDLTLPQGSPAQVVSFGVANAQDPAALTYNWNSSNANLIPNANIRVNTAAGTVGVKPVAGQNGQATITLTVREGDDTAEQEFTVTVNPPSAPVTFPPVDGKVAAVGSRSIAIPLHITVPPPNPETAGYISDGPDDSAEFDFNDVTLYATSSNPRLIPADKLNVEEGPGGNFTLQADPASNRAGSTMITIAVDNGDFEVDRSFRITLRRPGPRGHDVRIARAMPAGPLSSKPSP
jgi:hypothetical protein